MILWVSRYAIRSTEQRTVDSVLSVHTIRGSSARLAFGSSRCHQYRYSGLFGTMKKPGQLHAVRVTSLQTLPENSYKIMNGDLDNVRLPR